MGTLVTLYGADAEKNRQNGDFLVPLGRLYFIKLNLKLLTLLTLDKIFESDNIIIEACPRSGRPLLFLFNLIYLL